MNLAHVHLLLNHFPTIGFGIGLGLFLVGLIGKNDYLQRVSFVIFFLIALIAMPTYMSGNAAQEVLQDEPAVSQNLVRAHEDAALVAFILMEITGFVAWLGLWQFRLISRLASWNVAAVLVLGIASFGLMAKAANLGGEIRHPEIVQAQVVQAQQTDSETPAEEAPVEGMVRSLGAFVTAHTWVWPACETLHFIGLTILFTVVLIVDLRMLGMAKSVPFAALYQLLPLGILGFSLNFLTGMMFFIASPEQYTKNIAFYWKMLFVMLGGINVLYFTLLDEPWTVKAGSDAPFTAKFVAASAILLWLCVLYFGNMLPFIGNAF